MLQSRVRAVFGPSRCLSGGEKPRKLGSVGSFRKFLKPAINDGPNKKTVFVLHFAEVLPISGDSLTGDPRSNICESTRWTSFTQKRNRSSRQLSIRRKTGRFLNPLRNVTGIPRCFHDWKNPNGDAGSGMFSRDFSPFSPG